MKENLKEVAQKELLSAKLGKTLVKIRETKGISQYKLAQQADITESYLSQIEHDKKIPTLPVLERICTELGIPIFVFLLEARLDATAANDIEGKTTLLNAIAPVFQSISKKIYMETEEPVLN